MKHATSAATQNRKTGVREREPKPVNKETRKAIDEAFKRWQERRNAIKQRSSH